MQKFIRFIGSTAFNGHQLSLEETDYGAVIVHDRYNRLSGFEQVFPTLESAEEYIERYTGLDGVNTVRNILGDMGIFQEI